MRCSCGIEFTINYGEIIVANNFYFLVQPAVKKSFKDGGKHCVYWRTETF